MPERSPARLRATTFAGAVLYPFALTRAGLLLASWFGRQFAPSWTYFDPAGATRGWSRVAAPWLDVWGRYDTAWYLDLARHGYRAPAGLLHQQSNLAFFPLYGWLVRLGSWLLPASARASEPGPYLVALALSNGFALVGLALVYAFVRERWQDEPLARRTVLYLLLFPAGFFLSCAYSESLYLALAAGAFLAAQRGRWSVAGACAFLVALTRPGGVLLAPPLALLYLSERRASQRGIGPDALWLLAAPAALAAHAAHLALRTGDPLAVFHAQSAWGRSFAAPWTTLLHPAAFHPTMGPFELAAAALFLALSAALLAQREWALATFALLSLAPILLSGTLMSATRLLAVVFPAFVPLARWGERAAVDRALVVTFTSAQALFFLAWSRFYWVG